MPLAQLYRASHAGTSSYDAVATVPADERWVIQRVHGFYDGGSAVDILAVAVLGGGHIGVVFWDTDTGDRFVEALRKDVLEPGDDLGIFVGTGGTWYMIVSGLVLPA